MSYSNFTLKKVKQELKIKIIEDKDLFSKIKEIQVSDYLLTTLKYNMPLALAVGTEKVRSELLIANILLEVRRLLNDQISFFSGIALDVDKDRDLNGFCDFIISKSPEQFYLNAPIITIVEAKNENITGGLGQCIAEMFASNLFNEKEEAPLPKIYGAVTTGNTWRFLEYKDNSATIDVVEYHITNVNKIVGILMEMASATIK
ncbi:MAG TPA: hypothetical protein EYP59_06875 [Thiotrichaceae bacterium]|nr:hypothetical protein [Thiotrichaceae bacterium]